MKRRKTLALLTIAIAALAVLPAPAAYTPLSHPTFSSVHNGGRGGFTPPPAAPRTAAAGLEFDTSRRSPAPGSSQSAGALTVTGAVRPENWSQTLPDARLVLWDPAGIPDERAPPLLYNATYSFTSDADYADPTGWTDYSGAGTDAFVIPTLDGHDKVLEVSDQSTSTGAASASAPATGSVEFWMQTNATGSDGFTCALAQGAGTWRSFPARLASERLYCYYGGTGYVAVANVPRATWVHLRVVYNSTHYSTYMNGQMVASAYPHYASGTISDVHFRTDSTPTGYSGWVDAVDLSSDPAYVANRSSYLLLVDQFTLTRPGDWAWRAEAGGMSSETTWFSVPLSAPAAPTLQPITPNPSYGGRVYLDWSASSGAEGYHVYRHASYITQINDTLTVVGGDEDVPPAPGTYYYVVTAYNASGESAPSNCESVVVEPQYPAGSSVPSDYAMVLAVDSSYSPNGFTGSFSEVDRFDGRDSAARLAPPAGSAASLSRAINSLEVHAVRLSFLVYHVNGTLDIKVTNGAVNLTVARITDNGTLQFYEQGGVWRDLAALGVGWRLIDLVFNATPSGLDPAAIWVDGVEVMQNIYGGYNQGDEYPDVFGFTLWANSSGSALCYIDDVRYYVYEESGAFGLGLHYMRFVNEPGSNTGRVEIRAALFAGKFGYAAYDPARQDYDLLFEALWMPLHSLSSDEVTQPFALYDPITSSVEAGNYRIFLQTSSTTAFPTAIPAGSRVYLNATVTNLRTGRRIKTYESMQVSEALISHWLGVQLYIESNYSAVGAFSLEVRTGGFNGRAYTGWYSADLGPGGFYINDTNYYLRLTLNGRTALEDASPVLYRNIRRVYVNDLRLVNDRGVTVNASLLGSTNDSVLIQPYSSVVIPWSPGACALRWYDAASGEMLASERTAANISEYRLDADPQRVVYFSAFASDLLGLPVDTVRLYVDGERKAWGPVSAPLGLHEVRVLDYSGALVYSAWVNWSAQSEYSIYVPAATILISNNYNESALVRIEKSGVVLQEVVVPALGALQFRVTTGTYAIDVYNASDSSELLDEFELTMSENSTRLVSFGFAEFEVPPYPDLTPAWSDWLLTGMLGLVGVGLVVGMGAYVQRVKREQQERSRRTVPARIERSPWR